MYMQKDVNNHATNMQGKRDRFGNSCMDPSCRHFLTILTLDPLDLVKYEIWILEVEHRSLDKI